METVLIDEKELNNKYVSLVNEIRKNDSAYQQQLKEKSGLDISSVPHDFTPLLWFENSDLETNMRNLIHITHNNYLSGLYMLTEQLIKRKERERLLLFIHQKGLMEELEKFIAGITGSETICPSKTIQAIPGK